ncbi:p40 domain protein [Mycobacterium kansasii]|uniref:p40 domain protein n=1 Tax=Mycobacterium kansasii TaxID=1768 RepID=A0A1V3WPU1_MYCKA|nr:p40 domain protein [Mycobacterium kansasii]
MTYADIRQGGPFFDDLSVGQTFDWAPAMTLSPGWPRPIRRS